MESWLPVTTKRQFVRMYNAGLFGNRAPTWSTLAEFQASDYKGLIHIRNRVAGAQTWYNIKSHNVTRKWVEIVNKGTPANDLYLSSMAPHHLGLVQGEVQQSTRHLDLTYCSAQLPMREALAKETKTANGVVASQILSHYMDPCSYDWLQVLLTRYPGHVIEFSIFDCFWGTVPRRNTVWWEVRAYSLLTFAFLPVSSLL